MAKKNVNVRDASTLPSKKVDKLPEGGIPIGPQNGKGSSKRPTLVSIEEADLRWELAFGKPSKKRKSEILQLLGKNDGEK
jgi:hypothetical protein